MDPNDMIILANLAQNMMDCGNNVEALKCAQTVLKQVRLVRETYIINGDSKTAIFLDS